MIWLGAVVLATAAWLTHKALVDRWDRWSPSDFALELCVVQRFGPLPDVGAEAERRRRDAECIASSRRAHRSAREGPSAVALTALVLVYVGLAAARTRRALRGVDDD